MIQQLAGGDVWVTLLIKIGIAAGVLLPFISVTVMFTIWWERKVAGHAQSRVGPMHVGGWHGWAQSLADGVKLIFKEDLIPASADQFLFRFAPYMAFAPVFAAYLSLPFGPQFVFEDRFNIGLLFILAVLEVEVLSVIMAGWGSNSKWAVYGAMREACQIVSYAVPLGLSLLTGLLVAGTLNVTGLCLMQGAGMYDWFAFHSPFALLAFFSYYIASLASCKRAPFDLPEAESELVAGFHTEYSGLRWSLFFFAEYGAMFVVSVVAVCLFLGGWNSPLGRFDPIHWMVGYDPVSTGRAFLDGTMAAATSFETKAAAINAAGGGGRLTGAGLVVVNVYSAGWLIVKSMSLVFTQIWIRWTLPRIRIDQVLHTCIKVLLPLSLILLCGTVAWLMVVPQAQAMDIHGQKIADPAMNAWGHLLGPVPMVQMATQVTLMLLCLAGLGSLVAIMVQGWTGVVLNQANQPRKTLFPDVMPVGDSVAFTTGPAAPEAPAPAAAAH